MPSAPRLRIFTVLASRANRIVTVLALLASIAVPASQARAQGEPFTSGLRWTLPAQLSQPWIPSSVAFAAGDQLVWAGGPGNAARVVAAPTSGSGLQVPLQVDPALAGGTGSLFVAGAAGQHALYALSQRPSPDAWHRRTEVTRYDVLAAAAGAPFAPAWTIDLGLVANGPGRLATDAAGEQVVAAAFDEAAQRVTVLWLDGRAGTVIGQEIVAAQSLRALALSGDGRTTALVAGTTLYLWGHPQAGPVALPLGGTTGALSLSANGKRVATGGPGAARVFQATANGFVALPPFAGGAGGHASQVGLSADGSTLGIAWWDVNGVAPTRLELRAARTGALHVVRSLPQGAGGLQNAPQAVRLSADGARAAFATWGDGGPAPEVVLLDRATGVALLEISLPGSALDLALDARGTRVAVATKNVHANVFGSTGEVRLYDTGERDLELLQQPRHGGVLHLAAQRPGATRAFFLLGRPSAPHTVPGTFGRLAVDRGGPLSVHSRPVTAAGRADLELLLPSDPALIGIELRAQAAMRAGGALHLSHETIDLLVL